METQEKKIQLIPWMIDNPQINNQIEAYSITRNGGYSTGIHNECNLSYSVGEDYDTVLANRKLLASQLGTDLDHMICLSQMHSTNIIEIKKEDGGKGMIGKHPDFYNIDASYTKEKGIYLLSIHADCTPVLVYCPDIPLVCAIHSGWKGNVSEITHKCLSYLEEKEGIDASQAYAYIGPSIEYRNFEVGQNVIDLVNQMSFDASDCYSKKDIPGKYLFDGKKLVYKQLKLHQIPDEHITISPYCTIENNDLFYSYRVEKQAGRNATIIKLK